MQLLPGAEPFQHEGTSSVGVLLCHGFTGSPQSMRPWAEHLAEAGHTVSLPLLPGHGTRWEDLRPTGWQDWYATVDRELRLLGDRCERVFVCGLSMGGTLALRLAARHGEAVAGVAVVNPAMTFPRGKGHALPVLRHLVPSTPGITSDIAREGGEEVGYDRVPLHSALALRNLLNLVRGELPRVTQPLLVMRSRRDHVVPPTDSNLVLGGVSSTDVTELFLERSFHVATLDHDAPRIFQETDAFITRLTTRKPARDGA
ncbi:alpha/beta fold hydrolase [Streptomyces calidiresistens]|uniref:Alpha/beta fold hydrolase n=1 Tax=Streptomyces calidiresistens TaxID=1485586 RepID=A0A7W3XXA7_9ACTN|nr:alpha/beta fold hydrolase [Streptomyces calidiresistens]MBB0230601.1 alpha/beta fold hydrolase [Streptomyces calidiresistens]